MKEADYESWWADYEEINRLDPGTRFRKELIARAIGDKKFKSVFDLGCGTGELLSFLHQQYPEKELFGSDLSKTAITLVKKKGIAKRLFIKDQNKAARIPGKYDAIICSEVIEHLDDWKKSFDIIASISKSGSRVIISTQAGKRYPHHLQIGHTKHFTLTEIEAELYERDFEIVRSRRFGWPFMVLKNLLVTYLLKGSEFKRGQISLVSRMGLNVFYYLYRISLGNWGPQIFIVADKL